jgi:hypothetical protein
MRKCTLIILILSLSRFGLSLQTSNPSPVTDEFLQRVYSEYIYPLMESDYQLTQSMRAKIYGYALRVYRNELGSSPDAAGLLSEIKRELQKIISLIPSEQPLWPKIEAAEAGTYDMEMKTLFPSKAEQIKSHEKDSSPAAIPSLNASIKSLRFYEGGYNNPPTSERVYGTRFSQAATRYVWWELSLFYPAPGKQLNFIIRQIWRSEDGSVLANQEMRTYILNTWVNSEHCHSWGSTMVPSWPLGHYALELYVDGKMIAKGSFEIY